MTRVRGPRPITKVKETLAEDTTGGDEEKRKEKSESWAKKSIIYMTSWSVHAH